MGPWAPSRARRALRRALTATSLSREHHSRASPTTGASFSWMLMPVSHSASNSTCCPTCLRTESMPCIQVSRVSREPTP
uniref:Putative secreted protein n=1 Tax=Ixodes ricinus TaxID=34613 RepID=A0A6B0U6P5_IXORI